MIPGIQFICLCTNCFNSYAAGCFKIKKCSDSQTEDECMPEPKNTKCGPLWTNLPDEDWAKIELADVKDIQSIGDFACPLASPNDPVFVFHHANVDRHFDAWLHRARKGKPGLKDKYLNYPVEGYSLGTNLNDIFVGDEFVDVLKTHFGTGRRTFAQVIESCLSRRGFDYKYDKHYDPIKDMSWLRDLRPTQTDSARDKMADQIIDDLWTGRRLLGDPNGRAFLASDDIIFLLSLFSFIVLCRVFFVISYMLSNIQSRLRAESIVVQDSPMIQIVSDSTNENFETDSTQPTEHDTDVDSGEEVNNRLPRTHR